MKLKVGVDIVYVPKVGKLMRNEIFVNKVFHASECKKWSAEHLAGVFAAKEAFFKAVNKRPRWLDIELRNRHDGEPELKILDNLMSSLKIKSTSISIAHEKDYAIAYIAVIKK